MPKYMVITLLAVYYIGTYDARSVPGGGSGAAGEEADTWKPPPGVTREDFLRCHGMPCDQWERVLTKLTILQNQKVQEGGIVTVESIINDLPSQTADGCLWYTEEQVDELLRGLPSSPEDATIKLGDIPDEPSHPAVSRNEKGDHPKSSDPQRVNVDPYADAGIPRKLPSLTDDGSRTLSRRRRQLEDFAAKPKSRWHNPIFFKFDGNHTDSEEVLIREAFRHWEKHTCLRFFEVNTGAVIPQPHLLVTAGMTGCYSFVGKTEFIPQVINLGTPCLKKLGTPVHEIGHTLGLWHEQQRADRDDHVTVVAEHVQYYRSQFWRRLTQQHALHYDYGSVMHYSWTAGSFSGQQTMKPRDPRYKMSMGQRVGLSYRDAHLINKEYCADTCGGTVRPACRRGGYQDPNNCSSCRCPDGFGGPRCQLPAASTPESCGGFVELGYEPKYIETDGYSTRGIYEDNTNCNWHIKAPRGHHVTLTFEGSFGAYCFEQETCYHWVEVKYDTHWDRQGPRFCCYKTPKENITSHTKEMVVTFRSSYPTDWATVRRGFRARVVAVKSDPVIGEEPTEAPTKPVVVPTPPGSVWGEWGRCQNHECKCGGCSQSTRHAMCGQLRCAGRLARSQTKPCERKCGPGDTYLHFSTGKVFEAPCPVCCSGFVLDGGRCVTVR